MNLDEHPSDQEVEQMATKQDTESKSGKEKNQLLKEKHLILQMQFPITLMWNS